MDPTPPPLPVDPLAIFSEQFNLFLVYLDRPLVQIQFLALGIIVVLAMLVEIMLARRVDEKLDQLLQDEQLQVEGYRRRLYKLLRAMRYSTFSLAGILLLFLAIFLLGQMGQPTSILWQIMPLFWLVLAYQIIIALFYLRFREAIIKPLHRYVLGPLTVIIVFLFTIGSFIDVGRIGDIVLFELLMFQLTVERLFLVVLAVYIIYVVAYLLQQSRYQLMEKMEREDDQRANAVASVLVVVRFGVLFLGGFVVAAVLGIDASTLALVGGGLSVGIGIGLQGVVANFVTGIILIFEQSLRPGDVVNVNGEIGTVDDLTVRATTIRTLNNVALIIPNERFFSSEVITYTKDNSLVRIDVPFRVSHGADPKVVRELALTTAVSHPLSSPKNAPFVAFRGFGDFSLDFTLLVWTEKPLQMLLLRSDLYYMLWETFQTNNIEIPFPQQDLNLGKGWENFGSRPSGENGEEVRNEK